jgi:DEAD/DEAH box helicase domain-containing protein
MAALPFASDDRRDGVFGLAFAMKHVATLLLMCDQHDIGLSINAGDQASSSAEGQGFPALSERAAARVEGSPGRRSSSMDLVHHTDEGDTPRIFIYDSFPGGIGFSAPLFGMHHELLSRTRELVAGCPCENGCPTCVGPVGQIGPLAKTVALRLLDHLMDRSVALPVGGDLEDAPF